MSAAFARFAAVARTRWNTLRQRLKAARER